MRRARTMLLAGAAGAVLAACSATAGPTTPTWEPSPPPAAGGPGPGAQASPIVPVPAPSRGLPSPSGSSSSSGSRHAIDPDVVATRLTAPIGLTMMPDGTALVGERTGRIVRVQPVAGQPVPTVRTLHGLDTAGDGGLLDLALSPTYDEDGLVYAYVTTPTDNRVVDFTLTGPVTPVVTGIPRGKSGNGGRIAFGADGNLYIGTGDAGRPALADDPHSLAGKVLRVDDIGDPADGNPAPSSPVWTSGHRGLDGLCPAAGAPVVLEVESGTPGSRDTVNQLEPGSAYGPATGAARPVATLPEADTSPGDCALRGPRIWVTSRDGHVLLSAPLDRAAGRVAVGSFTADLKNRYGRLETVVAAPDGALWLTTSNRDGHGRPVAADERVIRYVPSAASANSPV